MILAVDDQVQFQANSHLELNLIKTHFQTDIVLSDRIPDYTGTAPHSEVCEPHSGFVLPLRRHGREMHILQYVEVRQ